MRPGGLQSALMKKILLAWMLSCLVAATTRAATGTQQAYQKAFEAARNHQQTRYQQARKQYGKGPLAPYLAFAWLYYNLNQASEPDIRRFLKQHSQVPVSRLLRTRWLQFLARKKDWPAFLRYWQPQSSQALRCHHLQARWKTGSIPEADLKLALEQLWLNGHSLPRNCDPLLRLQRKRGWLSEDLRWQRFQLAMEAGQYSLARWLTGQLGTHKPWARDWLRVHGQLNRLVRKARHWPDQAQVRTILFRELYRLAVQQPAQVRAALNGPLGRFVWPAAEQNRLLARTALFAATDGLPEARQWLDEALQQNNDPQLRRWALRRALAEQDYWAVLQHFEKLPAREQQENQWLYWKARALEATGQKAPARHLFLLLSRKSSYYGFLAADRLAKPYNLCQQTSGLNLQQMQALLDRPALQRALALRQAGQLHYARMELAALQPTLSSEEKKQLALILDDEGWHDASIRLLANATKLYTRRFPLVQLQSVESQAKKRHLPASLLLAIIRAESAFAPQARSPVGARGLMQIMPAVGRKLARKFRIHPWHGRRLEEPTVNIQFGAAHLADYLQRFQGHPIPAIAAYNAGPEPVARWLQRPASTDTLIWMETLPYGETREYLRKVLAYQVIYQWRLKQRSSRISTWLKPLNQPFPRSLLRQPGTIPFWCQQELPVPQTGGQQP